MNNIRVILAVFLAAVIIASGYGIMAFTSNKQTQSLTFSDVYLSYAGADPNSTYSYHVYNGTPARLEVDAQFDSNISANLSYIYITTPGFTLENWTYQYGSYVLHSNTENSTFIGSSGSSGILSVSTISALTSRLTINIVSNEQHYNGSISIHVVFSGMPGGVVY